MTVQRAWDRCFGKQRGVVFSHLIPERYSEILKLRRNSLNRIYWHSDKLNPHGFSKSVLAAPGSRGCIWAIILLCMKNRTETHLWAICCMSETGQGFHLISQHPCQIVRIPPHQTAALSKCYCDSILWYRNTNRSS